MNKYLGAALAVCMLLVGGGCGSSGASVKAEIIDGTGQGNSNNSQTQNGGVVDGIKEGTDTVSEQPETPSADDNTDSDTGSAPEATLLLTNLFPKQTNRGENIDRDATFIVSFSENLSEKTTLSHIFLQKDLGDAGSEEVKVNILAAQNQVFLDPVEDLEALTTYRLILVNGENGLRSEGGNILAAQKLSYRFTTGEKKEDSVSVLEVSPFDKEQKVNLTRSILVIFDRPVSEDSLADAVVLSMPKFGKNVPIKLVNFSEERMKFEFVAEDTMEVESLYRITVGAEKIKALDGTVLAADFVSEFETGTEK